jgi:hypothetical protein
MGQASASPVAHASSIKGSETSNRPGDYSASGVSTVDATPTDPSYMLWDGWGGTYADAEKRPPDDGVGNPGGDPGGRDDELCWVATASNILEWTGWGKVAGMTTCDQMFQHGQDHWYDTGSWIQYDWMWWFDGTVAGGSYLDNPGGGNFWPTYALSDYYKQETDTSKVMSSIDTFLHQGYGCGIHIWDGGHAITVWGFSWDPSNPNYYTGLYVTDSDDKKYLTQPPPAPNDLRYETVQYDTSNNWWYFTSGLENNWHISDVQALERFPNQPPVANAGGPYVCTLGGSFLLDASASHDPDGYLFSAGIVKYEWDMNNDGVYEISSNSPNYMYTWSGQALPGTVTLRVTDLLGATSIATTTITTFGVQLKITPSTVSVKPGQIASYKIEVTNLGNTADSFNLAMKYKDFGTAYRAVPSAIQPAWTAIDKPVVGPLNLGAHDIATLTISVPADWAGMENAIYEFNATATSLGDTHVPPASKTDFAKLTVQATKASMTGYIDIELQSLINTVQNSAVRAMFKDPLARLLTYAVWLKETKPPDTNLQACKGVVQTFISSVANLKLYGMIPKATADNWTANAKTIINDLNTAIATPP